MYDSISGNTEYPLDPEFYTLNQLRHLMIDHPDKLIKFVGAEEYTVGDVRSWRGSYDIPSIEPLVGERTGKEIYEILCERIGNTMIGYKGGEFSINGGDEFYVAHYGDNSYHKVVGYDIRDNDLILNTKLDPY